MHCIAILYPTETPVLLAKTTTTSKIDRLQIHFKNTILFQFYYFFNRKKIKIFSFYVETTSESGISDLDMSEKCNCCPYGYHIDVDFVTFLQTLGGKNLNKQLKKIQRKRNERLQRSMEYVIDEVVCYSLFFYF